MANRSDTTGFPAGQGDGRGSGSDLNSDSERLKDVDNLQDKVEEDTFPASDPPSHSPMTGVNRGNEGATYGSEAPDTGKSQDRHETSSRADDALKESGLPSDFKDNKAAQFEYGRRAQAATLHFDRSENRLRKGNPDIGEVDMGIIDADKPVAPDDDDPFDSPDDPDNRRSNKIFDERLDRSVQDTPDPADEY